MSVNIDPFEFIMAQHPTIMIHAKVKAALDQPDESIFLIKEEDFYIDRLGKYPEIEVHCNLLRSNKALALLIQAKFQHDWNYLYDTWLNYYLPESKLGINAFKDLANQENLIFMFFNNHKMRRSLAIPNRFKKDFQNFINLIEAEYSPWSMKEFDNIKNQTYQKYPTGKELWIAFSE